MTTPDYTELFQERGGKYDHAMRLFPHARDDEFLNATNLAAFQLNHRIYDIPAGGAYLHQYLPKDCLYQPYEPCSNFVDNDDNSSANLLPLPFESDSSDIIFSIAGTHHLNDKSDLFNELARVAKPSSQLILADVYKDSAVAHFLDDFIGQYNSTGHDGIYIDETTLPELEQAGWQVLSAHQQAIYWQFATESELAQFCRSLFDLRAISDTDIIHAVEHRLGITKTATAVKMHWQLFYIAAQLNS